MSKLNALPTLATPNTPLDSCVSSHEILIGTIATIVQWECHRDGAALRAERQHSTYVLSAVASGACCVHDATWRTTLDSVNALLHRPGSTYRTTHPYGFIDSGWNISYDNRTGDEILERAGVSQQSWERPALTVSTRPAHLALRQIIAIQRHHSGHDHDSLELEELALELLEAIANDSISSGSRRRPTTREEHGRVVERAREYLNENFSLPLNLTTIAKETGSSPSHLCRLFKQSAGIPLRVYMHRLRLTSAIEAITLRGVPLARAALQSGFCSQAHMTSICKRVFGSPPGALRGLDAH